MSVLTQAFLTLVRSHLMSLVLLSVRHNTIVLNGFLLAHLGNERLGRFESGNVVGRDHDGRILGNVACRLLGAGLYGKATKTTEIDILTFSKGILDAFHEAFYNALHFKALDASAFSDFINDFSLSHFIIRLY